MKSISNKIDKNFIEENKSIIFESLNEYCSKNEYYYVNNLLQFLKNYLPMEEIQSRIFNYELIIKTIIENNSSKKEGESNNNQDDDDDDD